MRWVQQAHHRGIMEGGLLGGGTVLALVCSGWCVIVGLDSKMIGATFLGLLTVIIACAMISMEHARSRARDVVCTAHRNLAEKALDGEPLGVDDDVSVEADMRDEGILH